MLVYLYAMSATLCKAWKKKNPEKQYGSKQEEEVRGLPMPEEMFWDPTSPLTLELVWRHRICFIHWHKTQHKHHVKSARRIHSALQSACNLPNRWYTTDDDRCGHSPVVANVLGSYGALRCGISMKATPIFFIHWHITPTSCKKCSAHPLFVALCMQYPESWWW